LGIALKTSKANYKELDQLLSQGKWKEADQETGKVMLKLWGGKRKVG
jgi:hypothetical protein